MLNPLSNIYYADDHSRSSDLSDWIKALLNLQLYIIVEDILKIHHFHPLCTITFWVMAMKLEVQCAFWPGARVKFRKLFHILDLISEI